MIDLHCHTIYSDSNMKVDELVKMAKEKGITHLAVTDHDTTAGVPLAMSAGEKYGVEIIPGIEISAYDYENNKKVHILGYFIDIESSHIKKLCRPVLENRHEASLRIIKKVKEAGFDVRLEDVHKYSGPECIYKQHIMHVMIDKGYTDKIYSHLYKKLFSKGGIAVERIHYVDYRDAIKAVRLAGGIPVMAHPGQFDNFPIVEKAIEAGLLGIEIKHPHHDEEKEKKALEYAKRYDLLISGGSDFHGFYAGDVKTDLGSKSIGQEALNEMKRIKEKIDSKEIVFNEGETVV